MAISSNTTGLRPGVCTSTTRPTAPYEGQMIYETDTNRVLVWDNAAWVIPNQKTQNPPALEFITKVTATSGTTFTADNLFNSNYTNYLVVCSELTSSGVSGITLQLRQSGSTLGTSGYYASRYGYSIQFNVFTSGLDSNAGSITTGAVTSGTTTGPATITFEIFSPNQNNRTTTITGRTTDGRNTANGVINFGGYYNSTTAVDGFALTNGGNTWSNVSVDVYGYRN